jgi:hypothetical protein
MGKVRTKRRKLNRRNKRYTKKRYTKKRYTKKRYTKKRYTKKRYTKKRYTKRKIKGGQPLFDRLPGEGKIMAQYRRNKIRKLLKDINIYKLYQTGIRSDGLYQIMGIREFKKSPTGENEPFIDGMIFDSEDYADRREPTIVVNKYVNFYKNMGKSGPVMEPEPEGPDPSLAAPDLPTSNPPQDIASFNPQLAASFTVPASVVVNIVGTDPSQASGTAQADPLSPQRGVVFEGGGLDAATGGVIAATALATGAAVKGLESTVSPTVYDKMIKDDIDDYLNVIERQIQMCKDHNDGGGKKSKSVVIFGHHNNLRSVLGMKDDKQNNKKFGIPNNCIVMLKKEEPVEELRFDSSMAAATDNEYVTKTQYTELMVESGFPLPENEDKINSEWEKLTILPYIKKIKIMDPSDGGVETIYFPGYGGFNSGRIGAGDGSTLSVVKGDATYRQRPKEPFPFPKQKGYTYVEGGSYVIEGQAPSSGDPEKVFTDKQFNKKKLDKLFKVMENLDIDNLIFYRHGTCLHNLYTPAQKLRNYKQCRNSRLLPGELVLGGPVIYQGMRLAQELEVPSQEIIWIHSELVRTYQTAVACKYGYKYFKAANENHNFMVAASGLGTDYSSQTEIFDDDLKQYLRVRNQCINHSLEFEAIISKLNKRVPGAGGDDVVSSMDPVLLLSMSVIRNKGMFSVDATYDTFYDVWSNINRVEDGEGNDRIISSVVKPGIERAAAGLTKEEKSKREDKSKDKKSKGKNRKHESNHHPTIDEVPGLRKLIYTLG